MKENISEFFKEKGLLVIAVVCLAIMGIAAALLLNKGGDDIIEAKDAEPTQDVQGVIKSNDTKFNEIIEGLQTPAPTRQPAKTPTPDFTQKPAEETKRPTQTQNKAQSPVKGELLWGFALDELIYSKTLNQWMTHSGVDIGAAKGSEVKTPLAGTVEKVFTDGALGVTIIIDNGNDTKTLFANLKEEPPVKAGQKVNAGDVIGYVGDSAISECEEKSHLHFEYHINGKPVDPEKYVKIDKANNG